MLTRLWYQPARWVWLLWPFSMLYRCIVSLRRLTYRWGFLQQTQLPVCVIVVGNISVGGTGKTPFVIWLAQWLEQQGKRVGVISRGYGGQSTHWPQPVQADTDPKLVGDEPVLIVQRTRCPMMVGPNRVLVARQLLQQQACDVIISDDGLQHYALGRDIEIAIVDAKRLLGNGYCLPMGPLREPASRLKQVDLVVYHGDGSNHNDQMQLTFDRIYALQSPEQTMSLAQLQQKKIHALAAIGHPERFFAQLRTLGLDFIAHAFPDHHDFVAEDIDWPADIILMTEKDAVKCRAFADQRHYCVAVNAKIDHRLIKQLEQKLAKVVN